MPSELEVTYTSSAIGASKQQRRTVEALGLRRLHQTVRKPDNDSVRGMLAAVRHLVSWTEVTEGETI